MADDRVPPDLLEAVVAAFSPHVECCGTDPFMRQHDRVRGTCYQLARWIADNIAELTHLVLKDPKQWDDEPVSISVETPKPLELSPEEGRALFDERCRKRLDMGGEEFLRRWDAEELNPDNDDVIAVSMLLPFAR